MERDLAPLPAPMASIIGRASEIEIARGLIERDDIRLLSLTGPAGVGKTRLALEIAAVCAPHFDGNVSFVPLATLTDTSLLLGEIGSTLGVSDSVNPIAGVRQLLRGSTRLLVLDNLEQLPNAGLELARLLPAVAGLTILATSRSPLVMYGEYVLPVDPLPIPARGADAAELAASPAIQLLVDSARSANATRRFRRPITRCWPRLRAGSTDCRWRSSSRASTSRYWARVGCSTSCGTHFRCWAVGRATCQSGCKRCAMRSPGVTTCSRARSRRSFVV